MELNGKGSSYRAKYYHSTSTTVPSTTGSRASQSATASTSVIGPSTASWHHSHKVLRGPALPNRGQQLLLLGQDIPGRLVTGTKAT
eukprot:1144389-Pyramimonas_sp.AAC.1